MTPQLAWASHTGKPSLECPIFDLRFQAHDIISTWVFYTIIKSYHHNNQIPWKQIITTGHTLDENDDKIGKSIGNFLTPIRILMRLVRMVLDIGLHRIKLELIQLSMIIL